MKVLKNTMSRLLSMKFDTKRLTAVGETNKTEYTTNLESKSGFIQPLGDLGSSGNQNEGKVSQEYKLFSERIDIDVSDKIVYNGDEYVVNSVKDYDYGGFPHLESIIVKL